MLELGDFCFAHEDLFLIPVEELAAQGIGPGFGSLMRERGAASPEWVERFDAAFRLYWQRARELSACAPRHWLPPRVQNVCVALDPVRVRPFFQPLARSSCLLDRADFDPRTSSLEFSTYQFFHAERMSLARQIVPALVHDLGYWLVRTREELEDFRAGCRRAGAGEAPGWRALARALEWIPDCFDEALKPPPPGSSQSLQEIPGTGFLLPLRFRDEFERLVRCWTEATERRVSAYFSVHASRTGREAEELAEWVRAEQPHLIVTGRRGEPLWDPEHPERTERLCSELSGSTAAAARSLRADWSVVDARSRRFLDSLVRPEELPAAGLELDQSGLCYMLRGHKLVAYNVHESGMKRLQEPAPSFERWMLGARAIHEWGHLAVDAGYVPVPRAREPEFQAAQAELAELLDSIAADAPAPMRAHAAKHLAALERRASTVGRALVASLLERMSDWQSNLLAQHYLSREERETYVRNNVCSLVGELDSSRLFEALARYAFEYQYLAFSAVPRPREYFLATTWFAEQFLARGVPSESRLERLLALVGELCRCHEIDESRFRR